MPRGQNRQGGEKIADLAKADSRGKVDLRDLETEVVLRGYLVVVGLQDWEVLQEGSVVLVAEWVGWVRRRPSGF